MEIKWQYILACANKMKDTEIRSCTDNKEDNDYHCTTTPPSSSSALQQLAQQLQQQLKQATDGKMIVRRSSVTASSNNSNYYSLKIHWKRESRTGLIYPPSLSLSLCVLLTFAHPQPRSICTHNNMGKGTKKRHVGTRYISKVRIHKMLFTIQLLISPAQLPPLTLYTHSPLWQPFNAPALHTQQWNE